jgi:exodeoxyribonuclease VII small subunit
MATKKIGEKPKGEAAEAGISFERAMERLETIVGDMEGGALSLEDMIARFEEGQTLIKLCTRKLNEVEKKVEMLVKKGDEVTTEEFEADVVEEPPAKGAGEELF